MKLCAIALVAMSSVARADSLPVPVTVDVLPNGLHVVLARDPSVSSVVVYVRYERGGAGDAHGLAHLVERLMFGGTVHVAAGKLERYIDDAGGWTSSTTTHDHVDVFELVPSESLDLALWLEAERMAGLADGITDAGVASAITAVAAERRAALGDRGYGAVEHAIETALWPAGSLLGDGTTPTRADLRTYIASHVIPVNARLVIAGNFDDDHARSAVRRYFAWIPGGRVAPPRVANVGQQRSARHEIVADPVPKVAIAFHVPIDTPVLEVAAQLLVGRSSRLARELVDGGLATELHADVDGGELRIAATAKPEIDPARLATAIHRAIAELRDHEVGADELRLAIAVVEAGDVERFETLAIRAERLAELPSGSYLDRVRDELRKLTPAVLRLAASTWLDENASITVIGRAP